MNLLLPVRFTGEFAHEAQFATLELDTSKTAFVLVDCTFENPPESGVGQVLRKVIAPTIASVRSVNMKVVFIHGGEHGDGKSIFQGLYKNTHFWQQKIA